MQKELTRWKYTLFMICFVIIPYILLTCACFIVIWLKMWQNPDINYELIWKRWIWAMFWPYLLWLLWTIFLSMKRLANLDMSWFWLFLSLFPLINIFFIIYLMLKKGRNPWDINNTITLEWNNTFSEKNTIPIWMKLILIYYWMGFIGNVINILFWQLTFQFWPWIISWNISLFITFLLTSFIGIIFYWILKRKKIWRNIALYFLLYWILILVINNIFIFSSEEIKNFYLSKNINWNDTVVYYTIFSSLFLWVLINIVIGYYLYKNKNYFNK